jgi:hypothetical protein
MPPKVFISHASEDKARFVLAFATRLRAAGIDAWLDRWEMQPGDSLVRKLFDEGLQGADAVIVVLSRYSVAKPWVREELDAAFVKRVHAGSKLVPVVLDDCDVPFVLRTLVWERIDDLASYDASFARIVAAITGAHDKPPLGALPPARAPIDGLAPVDARVLQAVGDLAMQQGHELVEGAALRAAAALADLDDAALHDALEMLAQAQFVRVEAAGIGTPFAVLLTSSGLQRVGALILPDYGTLVPRVAAALVNQPALRDAPALASDLGVPLFWTRHALDVLAERGDITLAKYGGGLVEVVDIGPGLRRALG